ncbi:MAG: carbohydrate ABC transporter permease [Lachnospiraceae bacterium]|nr:carbohydrate ABC transporter permease [Lachnospiraceae bacterium]
MRLSSRILSIVSRILFYILLILTLLPFYLLVVNSFKNAAGIIKDPFSVPDVLYIINYELALPQIVKPMLNSVFVTLAIIVITCVLSLLAAYAFARYQFFLKEVLYFGVIALLMIPGFVLLIPQFVQVVDLGLYDTYAALILVPAAYQVAMGTFLMRSSIEGMPKSLFEAAELAGANDLQILRYIVVPLSRPILATVSIMTGLSAWNNYMWPLVASTSEETRQISVALNQLVYDAVQGKGVQLAGYVCASLPIVIMFCLASKSFIEGLSQGAVKG